MKLNVKYLKSGKYSMQMECKNCTKPTDVEFDSFAVVKEVRWRKRKGTFTHQFLCDNCYSQEYPGVAEILYIGNVHFFGQEEDLLLNLAGFRGVENHTQTYTRSYMFSGYLKFTGPRTAAEKLIQIFSGQSWIVSTQAKDGLSFERVSYPLPNAEILQESFGKTLNVLTPLAYSYENWADGYASATTDKLGVGAIHLAEYGLSPAWMNWGKAYHEYDDKINFGSYDPHNRIFVRPGCTMPYEGVEYIVVINQYLSGNPYRVSHHWLTLLKKELT